MLQRYNGGGDPHYAARVMRWVETLREAAGAAA
jgi:hypothetical protein